VLWVDSLEALVPTREGELYMLDEDSHNDIDLVLGLPDRVASVDEAQQARAVPLMAALDVHAGRQLSALAQPAPYTLRVSAFADQARNFTVVHLVNYDLPILGKGRSGEPIPARDVRLRLRARKARWWTPGGVDGEQLPVVDGEVTVPEVRIYAMVELRTA
jgi:hypothetical protein